VLIFFVYPGKGKYIYEQIGLCTIELSIQNMTV